jgi:hypothetical protein
MASRLPGNVLGIGKHEVLYEAEDEDGNKARYSCYTFCNFL